MQAPTDIPDVPPERRSASADAARAAELARLKAMTPRERIILALELGHRCAALRAPKDGEKG